MLTLTLLRHAKSSWENGAIDDHDRPLNGRGRRDAVALANALGDLQHPTRVLCSTALRTQQTLAALLRENRVDEGAVNYEQSLYLAAPAQIEALIEAADSEHLLVIGHNPGMEALASALAGRELTMKTSSFCRFERVQHKTTWDFVQQQTPRG